MFLRRKTKTNLPSWIVRAFMGDLGGDGGGFEVDVTGLGIWLTILEHLLFDPGPLQFELGFLSVEFESFVAELKSFISDLGSFTVKLESLVFRLECFTFELGTLSKGLGSLDVELELLVFGLETLMVESLTLGSATFSFCCLLWTGIGGRLRNTDSMMDAM